ncbi:hypothetical protein [Corynebacterium ciconiae]|uniref:hypothetical protein n=1 Tax=Corynebacterium ciconiae TaxID=227319 RepID=UPI0012E9E5D1|nr:hypothetical protein [Corynebacterium ciconiae]
MNELSFSPHSVSALFHATPVSVRPPEPTMPAFTSLVLRATSARFTHGLSLVDAVLNHHTRSIEEFVHRCLTCNDDLAEALSRGIGGALR